MLNDAKGQVMRQFYSTASLLSGVGGEWAGHSGRWINGVAQYVLQAYQWKGPPVERNPPVAGGAAGR